MIVTKPIAAEQDAREHAAAATTNASSSGSWSAIEPTSTRAAADPVDEPAADQRADRAGDEHRGQRRVAGRLGRAVAGG